MVASRRRIHHLRDTRAELSSSQGGNGAPKPTQEFFLPVWGPVRLTDHELRIVNHPAFARLGLVRQLGQTHLVFRGATHTRWEHSLGALHTATRIADEIERNFHKNQPCNTYTRHAYADPLTDEERHVLRACALLHDIGHIPAGHTLEDELGFITPGHDYPGRLRYIFSVDDWGNGRQKTLGLLIDELYGDIMRGVTNPGDAAPQMQDVVMHIVCKDLDGKEYPNDTPAKLPDTRLRIPVLRNIVADTICADSIDYLQRDWYHIGKPRFSDERILEYFEIRKVLPKGVPDINSQANDLGIETPPPESSANNRDTLVLNLRSDADIRIDGATAVFDLLESRYQLAEVALYHRKKLTAAAMIERLLQEANEVKPGTLDKLDFFLNKSDDEVVSALHDIGEQHRGDAPIQSAAIRRLAWGLTYRQLHRTVIARRSYEIKASVDALRQNLGASHEVRRLVCQLLEHDFSLPLGSVVIYCPPRAPHTKIAGVTALINERVDTLSALEDADDASLTNGLLRAQAGRFEGLWRFQVSVSPEAYENLRRKDNLLLFREVINHLIVAPPGKREDRYEMARHLAAQLHKTGRSEAVPPAWMGGADQRYPGDIPTLAAFLPPPRKARATRANRPAPRKRAS